MEKVAVSKGVLAELRPWLSFDKHARLSGPFSRTRLCGLVIEPFSVFS